MVPVIDSGAEIGEGVQVNINSHVTHTARIGRGSMIGEGCFIAGVVGEYCRIQNGAQVYEGVELEDRVFMGPGSMATNVRRPRADMIGERQTTILGRGCTIGARAVIVADVVGDYGMVGAGAVVTSAVGYYCCVMGVPAEFAWYVSRTGAELLLQNQDDNGVRWYRCSETGMVYKWEPRQGMRCVELRENEPWTGARSRWF